MVKRVEVKRDSLMRKEGSVLFNDALNTFRYGYLALVKDHSDTEGKTTAATWATFSI